MAPYSPPTAGRAGKLRLDFNENTVGSSPRVAEFLRQQLSAGDLAVYPEYGEVRCALAEFFGVNPDQFLLSNGTDEAIQVFINTYVNAGDRGGPAASGVRDVPVLRGTGGSKNPRSELPPAPNGFSVGGAAGPNRPYYARGDHRQSWQSNRDRDYARRHRAHSEARQPGRGADRRSVFRILRRSPRCRSSNDRPIFS